MLTIIFDINSLNTSFAFFLEAFLINENWKTKLAAFKCKDFKQSFIHVS